MTRLRLVPAVAALAVLTACTSSGSSGAAASPSGALGASVSGTSASGSSGASAGDTSAAPGDSGSPSPSAAGASASDSASSGTDLGASKDCSLLSSDAVSKIVGFTVKPPVAAGTGPVVLCTFTPQDLASGSAVGAVVIRKETQVTAASFAAARKVLEAGAQATTDLPGIGDEAYASTYGAGTFGADTVVVRKGTSDVLVTLSGGNVTLDKAKALALLAITSFGL